MEVAIEDQPPQKKLKQATLSFFKGKNESSSKKPDSQGRKRHSSTGSESPSKIAKLSKPLAVSESPNHKLQNQKSSDHNKGDQEVSSSSEADSLGNKTAGKSLMDRFVKKVPSDCNEEISSTSTDLDVIIVENPETDKENCCSVKTKVDVKGDSPGLVEKQETEEKDEIKIDNNLTGEDTTASSVDHDSRKVDPNQSIEIETDLDKFNASLNENVKDTVTSTPVKGNDETSAGHQETPKNDSVLNVSGGSSCKKGRKVDLVKRAEKQKLKQEREEERLAKKKKLEEEKAEKERVRKEQKEVKEAAKQEMKEKLEKERLEREKLKEEVKLKKEEERKLKEEQRVKKQEEIEAKLEEKKKKEEEKIKEEEEKSKKEQKVKMVFQSFFKTKDGAQKSTPNKSTTGIFAPFQLKKDMHLAPALRRDALSEQKKSCLDQVLQEIQPSKATYFELLKRKDYVPKRTGRILRKNPTPIDEAGLEIVHDSEALKKICHKVKILKFHTNNRPPYCGTWRKITKLTPKNPFKKDEAVFDYELDSDDEWEEEEPGESLSCSDGEEDKGEEENEEEEEDGWMVPHGYLSEDEGCNEDEEISPEKLKLQQLAKAKAWEEEQKRKFHALPIVVVGCFFEHSPSITMSGDVRLLYEYKAVVIGKEKSIPTVLSNIEVLDGEDAPLDSGPVPKGPKRRSVPEEAMPYLIRLVHGNYCGIKRLIKEFRLFWLPKTKPADSLDSSYEEELNESIADQTVDVSVNEESVKNPSDNNTPNKSNDLNSSIRKSQDEANACECEISKRQLELKIMSIAVRENRQSLKKTAWFVHDSVLAEYNLTGLPLPNTWEYLSSGPVVSPATKPSNTPISKEEDCAKKDDSTPLKPAPKDQRSIMDFTKTKEELKEIRKSQGEPVPKPSETVSSEDKKPEIDPSITPKDKKTGGQRSIMDFTKSAIKSVKSSLPSKMEVGAEILPCKIEAVQSVEESIPSKMDVDPKDVPIIIIEDD